MISNRNFFAELAAKQAQRVAKAQSAGIEKGNQPFSSEIGGDLITEGQSKILENFAPEEKEKPIKEHEISVVPINQIQNVVSIPDYDPSESLHPVICRTEKGYFCVDDFYKVEAARQAGRAEIKCEVFVLSEHSDIDLMLRKTARRIMAAGGRAPFSQMALNVRACFERLMATENYAHFGQGGGRLTKEFHDNKQSDIRLVLASRFGRSISTISSYLSATEYLNQEVKDQLFAGKVAKAFFDDIRTEKSDLISNLKFKKVPVTKIIEEVSAATKKWYQEDLDFWRDLEKDPEEDSPSVKGGETQGSVLVGGRQLPGSLRSRMLP